MDTFYISIHQKNYYINIRDVGLVKMDNYIEIKAESIHKFITVEAYYGT